MKIPTLAGIAIVGSLHYFKRGAISIKMCLLITNIILLSLRGKLFAFYTFNPIKLKDFSIKSEYDQEIPQTQTADLPTQGLIQLCQEFLAHRIRISEILPWDRKSYLTHAILPRVSREGFIHWLYWNSRTLSSSDVIVMFK